MIACCSVNLTRAPRENPLVGPTPATETIHLLRQIASGPQSSVYVAELPHGDDGQGRDLVAVKVFRHRAPNDVSTLFRLRDVGRAIARLDHPVLAPPLAVAQVDDRLGLVSPYIDGVDLFDLCEVLWQTDKPMTTRVVCGIVASIAEALDAALHRIPQDEQQPLARLHRDLKPSNIMIDRSGGVRLLDLGVGLTSLAGREARAESLKKGLVRYLSPGRRAGKRGGAPSDIYALGVIGLELARGAWLKRLRVRNPEHDRHLAEVVARISDLGFRTEGEELAWRNLFLRMVAHDPDARPTAEEVATVCRTLQDTATGQDLPGFAVSHVAPWLETVPTAPDEDVDIADARLLTDPAQAPAGPLTRELTEDDGEGDPDWIETADGWQVADDALQALEELAVVNTPVPAVETDGFDVPTSPFDGDDAFDDQEVTGWSKRPDVPAPSVPNLPGRDESSSPPMTPVVLVLGAAALGVATLGLGMVLWWFFG